MECAAGFTEISRAGTLEVEKVKNVQDASFVLICAFARSTDVEPASRLYQINWFTALRYSSCDASTFSYNNGVLGLIEKACQESTKIRHTRC